MHITKLLYPHLLYESKTMVYIMTSIVQCDKCGNLMFGSQPNNLDGRETTFYRCPKCGYNYLAGLRVNKLTEETVKYIRIP